MVKPKGDGKVVPLFIPTDTKIEPPHSDIDFCGCGGSTIPCIVVLTVQIGGTVHVIPIGILDSITSPSCWLIAVSAIAVHVHSKSPMFLC
jgi:hypothetical protein